MHDFTKYNFFNLISTFARSMIEVFIPIYLYKIGYDIKDIFFYFLIMLFVSAIVCIPLTYIGNVIKYKWLVLASTLFFALTNIFLFNINVNLINLCILATLYAFYRRCYWIGKRYYELEVIPKEEMANKVSITVIISQVATIFASYIGALIISNLSSFYSIIIASFIFAISVIPLMIIKESKNKNKIFIRKYNLFKHTPKQNILAIILYEFFYISSFAFPLYLYLYVKTSFEYIGIFNIFVGISSMFFIYRFSKKMDKDKYDYVLISGILLSLTLIFKLNFTLTIIVLIIGLLEGLFSRMYQVGCTRNNYFFGGHFETESYNTYYEIIQNFSRLIVCFYVFLYI